MNQITTTLFMARSEQQPGLLRAFTRIQQDRSLAPAVKKILTDSLLRCARGQTQTDGAPGHVEAPMIRTVKEC